VTGECNLKCSRLIYPLVISVTSLPSRRCWSRAGGGPGGKYFFGRRLIRSGLGENLPCSALKFPFRMRLCGYVNTLSRRLLRHLQRHGSEYQGISGPRWPTRTIPISWRRVLRGDENTPNRLRGALAPLPGAIAVIFFGKSRVLPSF